MVSFPFGNALVERLKSLQLTLLRFNAKMNTHLIPLKNFITGSIVSLIFTIASLHRMILMLLKKKSGTSDCIVIPIRSISRRASQRLLPNGRTASRNSSLHFLLIGLGVKWLETTRSKRQRSFGTAWRPIFLRIIWQDLHVIW